VAYLYRTSDDSDADTMTRLTIGTRGSALALAQANRVAECLNEAHPELLVDIDVIKTTGDAVLDKSLPEIGGKGLFTSELEEALLEGTLDCAVHSLKDLPVESPRGLAIAAIPEREDARDAIIAAGFPRGEDGDAVLMALPEGARVGTSSLRRAAQLLAKRPDLQILDIRGNVDTRLRKLSEGGYDAIVLALAGLKRLDRDGEVSGVLSYRLMLPAAGQGALAIQARDDDGEVKRILSVLDHWATRQAVLAERAFLEAMGGGCHAPIAAFADVVGHNMEITGFAAGADLRGGRRDRLNANSQEPEWAGRKLARMIQTPY
jgi:hydroxymethylbilane synthase